jgi:LmbE family N-acetylglucosaminyl deacetylase
MRILAVGAHSDDLELLCAGTLAKYVAQGHTIFMAIATNGELGSTSLSKAVTAATREKEARAAAKIIGAELIWMGFPDAFLFSGEQTRLAFIDLLRIVNPDVVITHYPFDYHADHRTVAQILMDVRILGQVPNIKTDHSSPPRGKTPEIFFMDTLAGIDFQPQEYVDISGTFETKQEMLRQHISQSTWLEDQYQMSYQDLIQLVAKFRGIQAGYTYAEGFRHFRTWPSRPTAGLLP